MQLNEMKAHELLPLLKKKEISSTEITESVFKQIDQRKRVNAYISIMKDRAFQQAKIIDKKYSQGEIKKEYIAGIPMAVKDNICIKDFPTTCGSKILNGFRPPYNGTVIEKITRHLGIIVGKTNMDEFAMGSSTETSFFGPTLNPHNLEYIPGGSSGGSAAAVADNQTILAIGSDTGGSIRQPAALCGVVGMKPTYGLVSRYGLVAFASSLDQIGTFSRDVKDSALLLNVIAGYDPNDSTSIKSETIDYTKGLEENIKNLKIGVPREYFIEGIDKRIKARVQKVISDLEKEGAVVEPVNLPHTKYAVADYYIIAPSEASSNLARYDGVKYGYRSGSSGSDKDLLSMYFNTRREGFGEEVKRRILIGTFSLSSGYYDAYYLKAMKVRTCIKNDFEKAFKKCDCLITPTSPTPAFKLGEKTEDPLKMYLSDIFTISANLAGIPGISIPCGKTDEGLPIGLQILASHFQEKKMLKLAYQAEQLLKKEM
ncbi:MAG: Asp-tRNA(Asn)/Glu-tRNA(Gln) amidotransferase subunit GatA [Spirochaetes bacterium]|nr:Asp-tRNA(Asn)/Glu-tRNA(Gln) amidotransferase subunit GatA [Spirochaetota bacterium]